MSRRGSIDYAFVERQLALVRPPSWTTLATMCGVDIDTLRRACDPAYAPLDLAEAAARAPRLASGREGRPRGEDAAPPPRGGCPPTSDQVAPSRPPPSPPDPPAPEPERSMPPAAQTSPPPLPAVFPTAAVVARALVAAARVLEEDPVKALTGEAFPRCRFPAAHTLQAAYPALPISALGRMCGIGNPHAGLTQARKSKWWPDVGEAACKAAQAAIAGERAGVVV